MFNDNVPEELSFKELLLKNNEVSINSRNIQTVLTEVYKYFYDLLPSIMQEPFSNCNNHYNIRNFTELYESRKVTLRFGTEIMGAFT